MERAKEILNVIITWKMLIFKNVNCFYSVMSTLSFGEDLYSANVHVDFNMLVKRSKFIFSKLMRRS